MKCIHCQKELPDQASFCNKCGKQIPRCPSCKTLLTAPVRFCPKDGAPIPQDIRALFDTESMPETKHFCTRCGKPTTNGQRICNACLKKSGKKNRWLAPVLISLAIVLLLGLAALGYFKFFSDSPPSWLEGLPIVDILVDILDKDDPKPEEPKPTSPKEDPPTTEPPAADAPAASVPDMPAPDAPAPDAPSVEPVFLNELPHIYTNGKVWTRSNEPTSGMHHTNKDAPDCWSDIYTPGHTYAAVRDNCGNKYTYGIHVDGPSSQQYFIVYMLDGDYTTFSGYCACPDSLNAISSYVYDTSAKYSKYFEIYGDGEFLFSSDSMRYDRSPQYFEIDVTGVEELTILYPATKGPNEIATLYDGLLE